MIILTLGKKIKAKWGQLLQQSSENTEQTLQAKINPVCNNGSIDLVNGKLNTVSTKKQYIEGNMGESRSSVPVTDKMQGSLNQKNPNIAQKYSHLPLIGLINNQKTPNRRILSKNKLNRERKSFKSYYGLRRSHSSYQRKLISQTNRFQPRTSLRRS